MVLAKSRCVDRPGVLAVGGCRKSGELPHPATASALLAGRGGTGRADARVA